MEFAKIGRQNVLKEYYESYLNGKITGMVFKHEDLDPFLNVVGTQFDVHEFEQPLSGPRQYSNRFMTVEVTGRISSRHDAPFEGIEVGHSIVFFRVVERYGDDCKLVNTVY